MRHCSAGPSRATTSLGPGKPLSRGPITTLFRMRLERAVQRKETRVGMSPHHLTRGLSLWGSVVSSRSGARGGAQAENGFYAYLRSERSHLEHTFQYFWAMAGPETSRGPEKLPLSLPLDGPVVQLLLGTIFATSHLERSIMIAIRAAEFMSSVIEKQQIVSSNECVTYAAGNSEQLLRRCDNTECFQSFGRTLFLVIHIWRNCRTPWWRCTQFRERPPWFS